MQFSDFRTDKIYIVTNVNKRCIGIIIPAMIKDKSFKSYTIQTFKGVDWTFLDDSWGLPSDAEAIKNNFFEFINKKFKTEDDTVISYEYIINRIFTDRINRG